jgi:hypothetical protein
MSNISKANKLAAAIELLAEADALVQQALRAGNECYAIHNTIEDTIDTLTGYVEQLEEMQITD